MKHEIMKYDPFSNSSEQMYSGCNGRSLPFTMIYREQGSTKHRQSTEQTINVGWFHGEFVSGRGIANASEQAF